MHSDQHPELKRSKVLIPPVKYKLIINQTLQPDLSSLVIKALLQQAVVSCDSLRLPASYEWLSTGKWQAPIGLNIAGLTLILAAD